MPSHLKTAGPVIWIINLSIFPTKLFGRKKIKMATATNSSEAASGAATLIIPPAYFFASANLKKKKTEALNVYFKMLKSLALKCLKV